MKKAFKICSTLFLYILFFVLMCVLFYKKSNYMVDELLTYNLANSETAFVPEDGITYSPASVPFMESLTSNGKLDFSHVWKLQTNDSSPPFYYAVVHVVCTLFPNTFSMKYAAVVNIFFQLLVLFFYRKIVRLFTKKEWLVWCLSLFYILCPAILSICSLLRMYSMVLFVVTTLIYLVLRDIERFSKKDFIYLTVLIICGALTDYYFLVYIFFLFAVLGIIMLIEKRYKEVLYLIGSSVISGIASCLIFPAIINHLNTSGRGIEAQDNFENSNILDWLLVYYKTLNTVIFGGLLPFLVLFFVILLIVSLIVKSRKNKIIIPMESIERKRYCCLLIPVLFYLMLIAKVAPYGTMRYISPIFSVAIIGVWCLLYKCLSSFMGKKWVYNAVFLLLMTVILVIDFSSSKWGNLYLASKKRLEATEAYAKESDAICLYRESWEIYSGFLEMERCKSITFYHITNYDEFAEQQIELGDEIALFLVETDKEFLNDFLEANPQYEIVKKTNKLNYYRSIYLKRTNDNIG